ncbi:hypothetical protein AVMA1855_08915 [Acidovorax sp. SUPP1855]|uniref:hypothetical protein n=1 Tax=Acidovorax sp. SUPP1855 TaxID=431774 RepID=UPI0023DE4434|nr:hypothetical protein [Acidovorax sp. SUPP1855]GKS84257.1 hypothetical protein AVMA1855_08915 [Acidovorax sp. SUPP1855]
MQKINNAYMNAVLADASYVGGLNPNINLNGALRDRMTPALAESISKNFSVVTQIESGLSSFDATVWRANNEEGTPNPSGKIYVSMRGTQQVTDFLIDGDLALTGKARGQVNANN